MEYRLVLATRNRDKVREIQGKLQTLPAAILSLADFAFVGEVIEDQPDLYGNATKKACAVAEQTGLWAVADDTGLEVEALGGAPGVYAARYSGPGATYDSNCRKLLAEMKEIPAGQRHAVFRTVACLRTGDGLYCVEGTLQGEIGWQKQGELGFGYDPIFVLPGGKTLAEIDLEEKNRISHRGMAFDRMRKLLEFLMH